MRRLLAILLFPALVLTACVTINVYFPAAEVEQAAREFVDDVIGNDEAAPVEDAGPGGSAWVPRFDPNPVSWFIGTAHAQAADITLRTPAIEAIRTRMRDRFRSTFLPALESGAIGIARDGGIVMRDASKVSLRDRAALNQAIADSERDRRALYREVAVANGHPEWEAQVRETFAREWRTRARSGWWVQDGSGNWSQK
ncbi:DUF1318 domain-containing protein [Coralloluteibacterium stylophorae]|uniref:YdbL family protein n=1 Tax=Coralloluteibacterium stylophorae TaxID=1776034 RepID=A0A8J8AX99_9GAMM|nr:DUF1318 domain-containing protein [Coralloluteibacterium stylophorae]MBS7458620.1 YdbL family protein [Coralloluteibacterium stylophorae]